jgi:hypothetical protein
MSGLGIFDSAQPGSSLAAPTVGFSSVLILSLPLIASELLNDVQTATLLQLVFHETNYTYIISSFVFVTILSGFFTTFIGLFSDFSSLFRPRTLLFVSEILYTIGILLLLVADDRFVRGKFLESEDGRAPYGYTISGLIFTQLSINVFELVGRSLLTQELDSETQIYGHSTGGLLRGGVSFLFKLIFGLSIRSSALSFDSDILRKVCGVFTGVGLIVNTFAIVLLPTVDVRVSGGTTFLSSLPSVLDVDSFPGFFQIAIPFLVGNVGSYILDFVTPILSLQVGADEIVPLEEVNGYGLGYIGIGCGCLLSIAGAYLPRTRLGIRGTQVVSMFVALLFSSLDSFMTSPASHSIVIVASVFSGLAQGSFWSSGWSALGLSVPRDSIGRYYGFYIGLDSILHALIFLITSISVLILPFVFLVGGILALGLPKPSGGSGAYAGFGNANVNENENKQ